MTKYGYHCSHEQFAPSELLSLVQEAERAGFQGAMSSDHFTPWSVRQGHSGFSFAWLGAALQATSFPIGMVCSPAGRYHPAIVAQAAATLAEMFPGRFWIALGSGQAMNEHITGEPWPLKAVRNERLEQAAKVIRDLWSGEMVNHDGHFVVEDARLYSRPDEPPLMLGAAITPETAEWVGGWADGMITTARPHGELKQVVDAFRKGGGSGKPMILKVQASYASSDSAAREQAFDQWRSNIFPSSVLADLRLPEDFDTIAQYVRPEDLDPHIRISADLGLHAELLRRDAELGFDEVYIHNVGLNQREFIRVFGEHVLPTLAEEMPPARRPA
ncbi:MAG TPA: TIGR03885 family FMN-dependent LLM class oxidoreductase [Tepidiformaceae bacterium]